MDSALPRLCPADLGRRISIRAVRDDGTAFDTVGPLTHWQAGAITVEGRRGPAELGWGPAPATHLPRAVAGRVIPPDICAVDLLEVAHYGWPTAESALLDGWEVRWTGENDPRADSVRVATDPGSRLDERLAEVVAWYRERGAQPALQVPALWLADQLSSRGWTIQRRIVMMTARCDTIVSARTKSGIDVVLTDRATDAWIEAHDESPTSADSVDRMHQPDATIFVSAIESARGQVVGTGRASLHAGWGGITSVRTLPGWQRRGIAGAVTQSLAAWVQDQGVPHCYLQVIEENTPALALYRSLGFNEHHRYVYWHPSPAAPGASVTR